MTMTNAPSEYAFEAQALANPIRPDLARLEAVMCWPTDVGARDRWVRAALLEHSAPLIDEMPVEILRPYARDALSMPRLSELRSQMMDRFRFGMIAGLVLIEAMVSIEVAPGTGGLDAIRKRLAAAYRGTELQIEAQTMKNRDGPVQQFRPVVHLWAAWWNRHFETQDDTFPCRPTDLTAFLAMAEAIRRKAEATRAPRSAVPLMRPGEAFLLPREVEKLVGGMDFKFAVVSEGATAH